jgi:hypothetical protein
MELKVRLGKVLFLATVFFQMGILLRFSYNIREMARTPQIVSKG